MFKKKQKRLKLINTFYSRSSCKLVQLDVLPLFCQILYTRDDSSFNAGRGNTNFRWSLLATIIQFKFYFVSKDF